MKISLLAIGFQFASALPPIQEIPLQATPSRTLVIIDPGHFSGGPGNTGAPENICDGYSETDFNLEVSTIMREVLSGLLRSAGSEIDVILTSDTWFAESAKGTDAYLTREEKASFIASLHSGDSCVAAVVSIHANWSRNDDARGLEIYYEDPNDLLFAEICRKRCSGIGNIPDRGLVHIGTSVGATKFLGPLGSIPSILFEAGYISNPSDRRALAAPSYRPEIAEALSRSIVDWLILSGKIHFRP